MRRRDGTMWMLTWSCFKLEEQLHIWYILMTKNMDHWAVVGLREAQMLVVSRIKPIALGELRRG
jgi:hypothetical protein